ncbi:hypothetical protein B841_02775 [Corynebacterium maris DSM 45190]|uniref:Uncharacterized protein n=1 Tax=Corynebacterium maris DSM 45190 TaxID=1224163 RepID=S5TH82_9CORY|nr:hypothetical protein [Corynebacterium maris]AGS34038.1 hypothetical protein B841_02775 [Corynebacterium maris DSM 45190]
MDANTLITAIAGLVGVLIGGGITMGATRWSAKVQREHHNRVVQHEKVIALWDYIQGDTWREHGQNYRTAMDLRPETRKVGTYPTLGDHGQRLAGSALLHAMDQEVEDRLGFIEGQFHELTRAGLEAWSHAKAHAHDQTYTGDSRAIMKLEDRVTALNQAVTTLAISTKKRATGQE